MMKQGLRKSRVNVTTSSERRTCIHGTVRDGHDRNWTSKGSHGEALSTTLRTVHAVDSSAKCRSDRDAAAAAGRRKRSVEEGPSRGTRRREEVTVRGAHSLTVGTDKTQRRPDRRGEVWTTGRKTAGKAAARIHRSERSKEKLDCKEDRGQIGDAPTKRKTSEQISGSDRPAHKERKASKHGCAVEGKGGKTAKDVAVQTAAGDTTPQRGDVLAGVDSRSADLLDVACGVSVSRMSESKAKGFSGDTSLVAHVAETTSIILKTDEQDEVHAGNHDETMTQDNMSVTRNELIACGRADDNVTTSAMNASRSVTGRSNDDDDAVTSAIRTSRRESLLDDLGRLFHQLSTVLGEIRDGERTPPTERCVKSFSAQMVDLTECFVSGNTTRDDRSATPRKEPTTDQISLGEKLDTSRSSRGLLAASTNAKLMRTISDFAKELPLQQVQLGDNTPPAAVSSDKIMASDKSEDESLLSALNAVNEDTGDGAAALSEADGLEYDATFLERVVDAVLREHPDIVTRLRPVDNGTNDSDMAAEVDVQNVLDETPLNSKQTVKWRTKETVEQCHGKTVTERSDASQRHYKPQLVETVHALETSHSVDEYREESESDQFRFEGCQSASPVNPRAVTEETTKTFRDDDSKVDRVDRRASLGSMHNTGAGAYGNSTASASIRRSSRSDCTLVDTTTEGSIEPLDGKVCRWSARKSAEGRTVDTRRTPTRRNDSPVPDSTMHAESRGHFTPIYTSSNTVIPIDQPVLQFQTTRNHLSKDEQQTPTSASTICELVTSHDLPHEVIHTEGAVPGRTAVTFHSVRTVDRSRGHALAETRLPDVSSLTTVGDDRTAFGTHVKRNANAVTVTSDITIARDVSRRSARDGSARVTSQCGERPSSSSCDSDGSYSKSSNESLHRNLLLSAILAMSDLEIDRPERAADEASQVGPNNMIRDGHDFTGIPINDRRDPKNATKDQHDHEILSHHDRHISSNDRHDRDLLIPDHHDRPSPIHDRHHQGTSMHNRQDRDITNHDDHDDPEIVIRDTEGKATMIHDRCDEDMLDLNQRSSIVPINFRNDHSLPESRDRKHHEIEIPNRPSTTAAANRRQHEHRTTVRQCRNPEIAIADCQRPSIADAKIVANRLNDRRENAEVESDKDKTDCKHPDTTSELYNARCVDDDISVSTESSPCESDVPAQQNTVGTIAAKDSKQRAAESEQIEGIRRGIVKTLVNRINSRGSLSESAIQSVGYRPGYATGRDSTVREITQRYEKIASPADSTAVIDRNSRALLESSTPHLCPPVAKPSASDAVERARHASSPADTRHASPRDGEQHDQMRSPGSAAVVPMTFRKTNSSIPTGADASRSPTVRDQRRTASDASSFQEKRTLAATVTGRHEDEPRRHREEQRKSHIPLAIPVSPAVRAGTMSPGDAADREDTAGSALQANRTKFVTGRDPSQALDKPTKTEYCRSKYGWVDRTKPRCDVASTATETGSDDGGGNRSTNNCCSEDREVSRYMSRRDDALSGKRGSSRDDRWSMADDGPSAFASDADTTITLTSAYDTTSESDERLDSMNAVGGCEIPDTTPRARTADESRGRRGETHDSGAADGKGHRVGAHPTNEHHFVTVDVATTPPPPPPHSSVANRNYNNVAEYHQHDTEPLMSQHQPDPSQMMTHVDAYLSAKGRRNFPASILLVIGGGIVGACVLVYCLIIGYCGEMNDDLRWTWTWNFAVSLFENVCIFEMAKVQWVAMWWVERRRQLPPIF